MEAKKGPAKKEKTKSAKSVNFHSSAIYIKNKKTGKWEVKNPAGSVAYNYLCGHEFDWDQT